MTDLWLKSMDKLKIDKSRFNSDDIFNIVGFIHNYEKSISIPVNIITQIRKDMGIYKKYDAIAMWVGNGGLIEHEPKFIKELVKIFGIEE